MVSILARPRDLRLPVVVAIATLGLSWLVIWSFQREFGRLEAGRFERMTDRVIEQVGIEFHGVETALVTLAAVQREHRLVVNRSEWDQAVDALVDYAGNGILALGFVRRVPRDAMEDLERQMREAGYVRFSIEANGVGPDALVVTNIAPLPENADALGLDLSTGTTRRTAADEAAAAARFTLSRRINLIDGTDSVPGVLFFHPIYEGGVVPESTEARAMAVVGWPNGTNRRRESEGERLVIHRGLSRGLGRSGHARRWRCARR